MPTIKVSAQEQGPTQIKEAPSSGGGKKYDVPTGNIISGLQLGRDPDGQRWLNIWWRELTIE